MDLNADLGESFGIWSLGRDEKILPYLSSCNIACGLHAGDPLVMQKTVRLAAAQNIGIGAHPSYPDLQGFGRRKMELSPEEVYAFVLYQIGALHAFLKAQKAELAHVKPHGALYNLAAKDKKVASAIASAIKDFDPNLIFLGQASSSMIEVGQELGLRTCSEAFADRNYTTDGSLLSRSHPEALIINPQEAAQRAVKMIKEGKVRTVEGEEISISFQSLCVHGDNPAAAEILKAIRQAFMENGIQVLPLRTLFK